MAIAAPPAGGRATEAGMAFQAGVGVWFAAHVMSETPIGSRFGLADAAIAVGLQFETGKYLDDVSVHLSDGSQILVQCKTAARVSGGDVALASTVKQLVSLLVAIRDGAPITLDSTAAVLAVPVTAPSSLDDLHSACRFFDLGAHWEDASGHLNQAQQRALEIFAEHARNAWFDLASSQPANEDLVDLAKLFRVVRFDVDKGGADYREAASDLGARLLGKAQDGPHAVDTLEAIARRLIRTGAPANRDGLVGALRANGVEDTRNPRFEKDLERLREVSRLEVERLGRHARLQVGARGSADGSVLIPRECLPALREAIDGGSLLVIGEPGAGKTGVLVTLAEELLPQAAPFVFISVDRLGGVANPEDLRKELELEHSLLKVLAAWPGSLPGVLIIDALDASRGGPSERLFATLIEDGLRLLGDRWSIVASIRTFDLRNGRRFRELVTGTPPAPKFADRDFANVRHFRIPRLTEGEVGALSDQNLAVGHLAQSAPDAVRDLLRNVFNLSLAAELIGQGVSAESIRRIETQSDLIERYEDERLPSARLTGAVADAVKTMVERRRLIVPKIAVRNDAIDDVLASGVMASAGDRIAFAHHVLFDHAAGRFYLEWDDHQALINQVTADPTIGFLLGPSLRFAIEKIWRDDSEGRGKIWKLIADVGANDQADPVISSVALRTAAERVATTKDVADLCNLIATSDGSQDLGPTISRLARFVMMSMEGTEHVSGEAAVAWAKVAKVAIETGQPSFADGCRFILWALYERADLSNEEVAAAFGEAARSLLAFAWSSDRPISVLTTNAIRFVCRSYATAPAVSRNLLGQILLEPRFSKYAHQEAPWLAEGVSTIAKVDPAFAREIYRALFGQSLQDDGQTWLGGAPSRILPLSSNRRQDYEHARWHLRRAFPAFLRGEPALGTQVASETTIALAMETRSRTSLPVHTLAGPAGPITIIEDDQSLDDWRESRRRRFDPGEDILTAFTQFLRECTDDEFLVCVRAALDHDTATSVWARILGVAVDRLNVSRDLLWPLVRHPEFLTIRGLSRDAVFYLAAVFPTEPTTERRGLEQRLLDYCREIDVKPGARSFTGRALSVLPEENLVSPEIRQLKAELEAEGRLTGNRPFISTSVSFEPADDLTDHLLERDGVDLKSGPDRELRDASRNLEKLVRHGNNEADRPTVVVLWAAIESVRKAIERPPGEDLHPQSLQAAWGAISNAAEKILTEGSGYDPGEDGHPSLEQLASLFEILAASPFPAPGDDDGDMTMAWGNWDVRVYAASGSIDLAAKFGKDAPYLVDRLPRFLSDPVPTVRLQVAQALNTLWEVARPKMWEMVERVAAEETNPGVLGFFVAGPLVRLTGPEPDRCEGLATSILARQPKRIASSERQRRETLAQALGQLAGWLWIERGRPASREWITQWVADLGAGQPYLWELVSGLRDQLFAKWNDARVKASGDAPSPADVQGRAHEVLDAIVEAASRELHSATQVLLATELSDAERAQSEAIYREAESLLDHAGNQLYFGAGAFKHSNEGDVAGLPTLAAMQEFLQEYSHTLDVISLAATPRTLHHLIELYEYLAAAAPEAVFDRIADLLVGPAAKEGYHFESLGSDVLVRLVRRYLADHRNIFDDETRRLQLVRVLELFSSAGWPDALRLLYELPDLLR